MAQRLCGNCQHDHSVPHTGHDLWHQRTRTTLARKAIMGAAQLKKAVADAVFDHYQPTPEDFSFSKALQVTGVQKLRSESLTMRIKVDTVTGVHWYRVKISEDVQA